MFQQYLTSMENIPARSPYDEVQAAHELPTGTLVEASNLPSPLAADPIT
jgi:hypothetical protein